VAGPTGGGPFPGLDKYLTSILDRNQGAYGYLSGYLDGSGGLPKLNSIEIGNDDSHEHNLLQGVSDDIAIHAMHVPHAIVPAIAFRLDVRGKSIVFASDQNGSNQDFPKFARDATLLVMHMPIHEGAGDAPRKLHAIPSEIGEIATAANAKTLLLSHFMPPSLKDLKKNVQIVEKGYAGDVETAVDLYCKAL